MGLGVGATLLAAQPVRAEVEVGLTGGLHVFSPNNELAVVDGEDAAALGDTAFIGARLGLYLGHMLGLEGELGVMPASFSEFDIASTVVSYRLQAVLQFGAADPARKLLPFILLGAGLNTVPSIDATSPTVTDDIDSMAYAGAGAKYRLGGGWGVRLDARAMMVPSSRVNTDDPSKDKFAADYEVLGSIYKSFGGKRRHGLNRRGLGDDGVGGAGRGCGRA
jgi:Outer membrane protein beta-barrel domain